MAKINLSEEDLKILSESINNETEIPQELLLKLAPSFFDRLNQQGQFDFEKLQRFKIPTLEYAGKRTEAVILAQANLSTGAAPLQVVRKFGNGNEEGWKNLIVQGDNLQFLKTCYLNKDPLIKDKVKGKVKLIYIDPPFATKADFTGSDGEYSYSDKIDRAEFLEGIRERLIYLKAILGEDGSIYFHLDQRMSHYIKIIMDEIFGKNNFRNEIVWTYSGPSAPNQQQFSRKHDVILWYTRTNKWVFNKDAIRIPYHETTARKFDSKGTGFSGERADLSKGKIPEDWWYLPIVARIRTEIFDYPTQKPEALLGRIIRASSNPGDLVLDCFAGSGTTGAVAEKLGRRWIMCDFGKHAIYTMQKRIWQIAESKKLGSNAKKNEKYGIPPKPFAILSAGAYDFSKIIDLRKNKEAYISFVLGLFGIVSEDKDYTAKYKLNNIYAEKENNPVEIFPIWDDDYLRNIKIDEAYLKGIVIAAGSKLKGDYYIIMPETCTVVGDTSLKNSNNDDVNFILLKFPYKLLEDFSRQMQIEEQPDSLDSINRLISSSGFYFNEEVKIKISKLNNGFQITDLETNILDRNNHRFKGIDGLSMLLIDKNYDGKVFNLDATIYLKDISEEGIINISGLNQNSAVIAIDKHGNESKITYIS